MDFPVVQYADDTLIMIKACLSQISVMQDILENYATSTGLHINFNESLMIPINISESRAAVIAQMLGCSI